ncbi:MAG: hypothetical protein WC455_19745 [Dehalococcoidia bacterium]
MAPEKDTLASIDKSLAVICTTLDIMRKDYNKIIYALIGIVAASFGMKFIATPWYVDLAVYICELVGVFVFFQLISVWKDLNLANKAMRIVLITIMLISSVTQSVIYHPGHEASPPWFAPIINILLILLGITSMWAVWKHNPKSKDKKCGDKDDTPTG